MIVAKVGGGKGIPIEAVCQDVCTLVGRGERLIFVHGASHETNLLSTALGKPPRFVTSISGVESRYTDRETLEIFTMAYVGKMNKLFVERLQQLGVNAVGLCGADGRSMEGERKAAIKVIENGKRKVLRDDFTGRVEKINTGLLTLLLEASDPETGRGLSENEIRTNIITFIGAGHETTANALTWALGVNLYDALATRPQCTVQSMASAEVPDERPA